MQSALNRDRPRCDRFRTAGSPTPRGMLTSCSRLTPRRGSTGQDIHLAETNTDYITVLRAVRIKRPRAPKGWRCTFCGKGDTKKNPAYEYDFSTASSIPLKYFHHPDCIQKHWEQELLNRRGVWA